MEQDNIEVQCPCCGDMVLVDDIVRCPGCGIRGCVRCVRDHEYTEVQAQQN